MPYNLRSTVKSNCDKILILASPFKTLIVFSRALYIVPNYSEPTLNNNSKSLLLKILTFECFFFSLMSLISLYINVLEGESS